MDWSSKDGHFRRQVSSFRETIEKGGKHPPELNRYKLLVVLGCPWAHRTLIVRKLKGLDKVEGLLPVFAAGSLLGPEGWSFVPYEETHPEFKGIGVYEQGLVPGHEDKKRIRDFYKAADPDYSARSTVPIIWDEKLQTIVNNESEEIIRIFNTAFDEFLPQEYKGIDYYPEKLRGEIDSLNAWVYDTVNNGVYKSGFATTAEAYQQNVRPLFDSLDRLEAILAKSGEDYLVGNTLTEADIRLFTTLIRFDVAYVAHFRCNINTIRHGYPHLNSWMKKLYWNNEAFSSTTNFESIKKSYFESHPALCPSRITPIGPLPPIEPL